MGSNNRVTALLLVALGLAVLIAGVVLLATGGGGGTAVGGGHGGGAAAHHVGVPGVLIAASVQQGFSFRNDVFEPMCYVTQLQIGEGAYLEDITVTDPENAQYTKEVVGVAGYIGFANTPPTAPININAYVSETTITQLAARRPSFAADHDVLFQFECYAYDSAAKRWYKRFHTDGALLRGAIHELGGALAFDIATDRPTGLLGDDMRAFKLSIGIAPPTDVQQTLFYASSVEDKLTLQWGTTVGGL